MATQKVKPDPDVSDRQGGRQQRRQTYRKVGTFALVTAVVVVVAASAFALWNSSRKPDAVTPVQPSVLVPAVSAPTGAPDTGSDGDYYRIPWEGAALSTPVEGELIAEANPYCCNYGYVRVYADGRVLSAGTFGGIIVERRLSPEGVELVRSGTLDPAAVVDRAFPGPASAWEDRKGKPYVPARYGACFGPAAGVALDVEALLDLLPTAAQALLRGSAPAWNRGCLEVTPEEARSLEEILSEARASRGDPWGWKVGAWSLRDGNGDQDIRNIRISPLYPDGRRLFRPGG